MPDDPTSSGATQATSEEPDAYGDGPGASGVDPSPIPIEPSTYRPWTPELERAYVERIPGGSLVVNGMVIQLNDKQASLLESVLDTCKPPVDIRYHVGGFHTQLSPGLEFESEYTAVDLPVESVEDETFTDEDLTYNVQKPKESAVSTESLNAAMKVIKELDYGNPYHRHALVFDVLKTVIRQVGWRHVLDLMDDSSFLDMVRRK